MKKTIAVLLTIALIFSMCPTGLFNIIASAEVNETEFAGGSGTASDPYLISTKEHLHNVRNYLSANFKLLNDLTFEESDFLYGGDFFNNGIGWKPIGTFTGTFDGNNCTIFNLYVDAATDNVGLFSYIKNGTVKNVRISNASISGKKNVGGICGYLEAGLDEKASIINCYVDGQIKAQEYAGGICGYAKDQRGWRTTGGINPHAYKVFGEIAIERCYNDAMVCANDFSGGILASPYGADCAISVCVNSGDVISEGLSGGIVAHLTGRDDSFSGYNSLTGSYTRYYYDYSRIGNCYNSGRVEGVTAGGIAGDAPSSTRSDLSGGITASYSVGNLCGTTTGGIIASRGTCVINSCYSLSTQTDEELRKVSTYVDWNFDSVWTMGGSKEYVYPELQNFTLRGAVAIDGDVSYGETVYPNIDGLQRHPNSFYCVWYVDGEQVHQGAEYTILASDVGKTLTVEVVSNDFVCAGCITSPKYQVTKNDQPKLPVIPELLTLSDSAFEIATVSTQEYSIDNIHWQKDGLFENLDPNKKYTVYSRILENDVYFLGESKEVFELTTALRPLRGVVNISGTPRFGNTLTANVSAVGPQGATYRYEWKRGDVLVGTASSYTIVREDIDQNITVYVYGTDDYTGQLVSPSMTAVKANGTAPAAPVLASRTNTSVTLVERTGYEYSKDKLMWQDSPVFTGLFAATSYTFYQRTKETNTTFASASSGGTVVTTLKNTISPPEMPIVESITNHSVTLKQVAGCEYSIDGLSWQANCVFDGLNPNTAYNFCQRIAETNTDYASPSSGYLSVLTLKNAVKAPAPPTVLSATDTVVTLMPITGYEYSKDGLTWQTSNVFSGLTTLHTYRFYQRIAETNTDYASATSAGLSFKVKNVVAVPEAPTLTEKTNNKIVVAVKTGYEYSINKTMWNTTGIFTGLQPNQTYTVYCRIPETDTHYASAISEAIMVTTLKNTVSVPSAPVLSNKTSNSVTLVLNGAYEYSKDGTTWQTSNVFSGLAPNTEYTFYQRKAETNTAYASEKSAGLKVCTLKQTVSAPDAPIVSTKTTTSVTLVNTPGYEYSMDGTTWQSSNVFDGLKVYTQYSFYQRVAETDTAYASTASTASKVTTLKKDAGAANPVLAIRVTATSVTLAPYTGYEYSKDGTTWQKSNVFAGLIANTSYKFYQRIAEAEDTNASASSPACNVTTSAKPACSIKPVAPIVADYNSSQVVLVAMDGYEYSKNGMTWQTSNTFTGLSSNTSYTFYQRIKATAEETASAASAGITVKTARTGTTAATNYDKLRNYINSYGTTNSDGNKWILYTSTNSGGLTFTYTIENTSTGIDFTVLTSKSAATKLVGMTRFALKRSSTALSIYTSLLFYSNYSCVDGVEATGTIDRSKHTTTSTYALSKSGNYITASEFSRNFSDCMNLICLYYDGYIYSKLGFGLRGLGFISYSGMGSGACDPLISYHAGSNTTRNARSATCTTDGYTGDTYCSSCGGKRSSGSTIACVGYHTYTNSCDKTCNVCNAERRVNHSYSNACDHICNVCSAQRESIPHIYDSVCDAVCNECDEPRAMIHVYDNEHDTICNECGDVRTLRSITVTSKPNKLTYVEGEAFDVTGLVVTATYDNNTGSAVKDYTIGGYTSTLGTKTITVTYEGKTATFTVEVVEKSVTTIVTTAKPNKLTYVEGEEFDATGLIVTAYYNNNTSGAVTNYTVSGYTSTPGTKTITVTYEGKTATFTVTVEAKVVKGDASGDGKVTITDMVGIKAYLLGKSTLTGDKAKGADVNGDGKITITDFIQLKAFLLGKGTL